MPGRKQEWFKEQPSASRTWHTLTVVLFWAYAVLNTYFVLTPVLGEAPRLAYLLVLLLLGGFSLSHAICTLGLAPRPGLGRLIGLAALSAVLMTAWDLVLDPQMVEAGHWVWHASGEYFGIPAQNFVGWLATTLAIYLAYRALEAGWSPRPKGAASPAFERLPMIIYALLASGYTVGYTLLGRPALAIIALFAMGTPCLAAPGETGI